MTKEMDILSNFIRQKNLKWTDQRKQILEIFLHTSRHLSVEDLYEIIKKKDSSIGQATVFRTLKLLCKADIAKEVDLGDKIIRYERNFGYKHHDHLICTKCGRFIEAVDPEIEELQERLCRKIGFLPQRHKMDIFGICRKCRIKGRGKIKR